MSQMSQMQALWQSLDEPISEIRGFQAADDLQQCRSRTSSCPNRAAVTIRVTLVRNELSMVPNLDEGDPKACSVRFLRSIVPYGLAILAVSPSSAAGAAELPVAQLYVPNAGGNQLVSAYFPNLTLLGWGSQTY